jgi:TolB-like protein/tetratricopeptide (TPR) repeat protein
MTDHRKNNNPEASHEGKGHFAEFIAELRRRRVIRVGLVYLVVAWLIMQVAETTFPALLLPEWSVTLVVVLLVFGFPVALILAWAYQVEADSASHTETSVQIVLDKSRRLDFIIIAGLAAVVVILSYELYLRDSPQVPAVATESTLPATVAPPTETPRPSIGVLPFVNLSDDPQNEYFADGLAEEILNVLVRMQEIDVAARTSSFYFKGKDVDISMVADHLGVANVLEGSVRRQGDTIRVTAQLIEAETGFHLWSNTYQRKMEDIFSIQDDIARQVATGLNVILSSDSDALLERVPTESVEAYQYYLQGRDYLRGEHNVTRLHSAKTLFDQAIEIDGNFAEAYAGLCDSLLAMYEESRSTDFFEQAERACHRGLTLDAGAGDVNTALGNLYRSSGQYGKAVIEFERAIALNNRNVDAYGGLADTFKQLNRLDEAERHYQYAIDLQPGYWRGHLEMGNFLYGTGRIQEAVESFKYVVNVTPDNATGHLNLATAYFMLGDYENAAATWRKSIELEPRTSAYLNVGNSYFFLGRFDDAAAMYSQAAEMSPDDFEVWGALGDAYRHAGDNQMLAQNAYRKAIELGNKQLEINQSDAMLMASLAQYYAHIGDASKAVTLISEAEKLEPQSMYVHYFSAVTNASLGNYDAAVDNVVEAVELGYPTSLLELDAGLSTIINNQRIEALIRDSSL